MRAMSGVRLGPPPLRSLDDCRGRSGLVFTEHLVVTGLILPLANHRQVPFEICVAELGAWFESHAALSELQAIADQLKSEARSEN
jgi:hypothetical protein